MRLHTPPGHPGIPPRWTSSAKSGVGTALSSSSHVWFTLSHGIFNEIYYPRIDQACTRDMGLIVTDGRTFFSEEKRDARSELAYLAEGVPAYHLTNTHSQGCYRIEKEIISDPDHDTVLQWTRFVPLQGTLADYHLYVLLAPHLGNRGSNNTAWVDDYKGTPLLYAQRDDVALALACSTSWLKRSVGFVGVSDGWQDLSRHGQMTWTYDRAASGNVALTGEIDLNAAEGEFVLALGFGLDAAEAGHRARASLLAGFETVRATYIGQWQDWQETLPPLRTADVKRPELYQLSAAMLRTHEAKHFPGGLIASLSIPWGFTKGDDDLGGYHLVWPRDLAEAAGGLLAIGACEDARRVLDYLRITQEADGHWAQNMWLNGTPYWSGMQLDEVAFPILLVDLARRKNALDRNALPQFWPMVRRAAAFLVQNGPVTQQDRWEEDPGYSPFTLAVEIAALLAAADLADLNQEPAVASYLRDTADTWNANIERWTYAVETDLAQQIGVEGYYVRIAPPEEADAASPLSGFVPIKNRPPDQNTGLAIHIVSPDALALVRFGLRAADDPRIVNTVKVIDALLKVETPAGPTWHRYNDDGYGEHDDGSAFDGTGIGRGWPLLTGERAHYELAAGHPDTALDLMRTVEAFANQGGLISEQVWDAPDIPEAELFFGQPSGSAMPLVWAHAEYVKLARSLAAGQLFDQPPQPVQRYQIEQTGSPYTSWRFNHKIHTISPGSILRLELLSSGRVHWSVDGWQTYHDTATGDTGLGVYIADLPTTGLPPESVIDFTFYWPQAGHWEGTDFAVRVRFS